MSLETLHRRIKATNDLREIVGTMKLLSSASVGPYEKAMQSVKKYAKTLEEAFVGLMKNEYDITPPELPEKKDYKIIAVLVGTDTGLVGKFNRDVITYTEDWLKRNGYDEKNALYIVIGKRLNLMMQKKADRVAAAYPISNSIKEIASIAETIFVKISQIVNQEKAKQVFVFHKIRENGHGQKTVKRQLVPLPKNTFANLKRQHWEGRSFPMVPENKQKLFSALTHEFLTLTLSGALTGSLACEHYTRMMNMQQAEKNIDASLEQMNLDYQQARQSAITDELIDIVSGSESMKKKKK